MVLMAKNPEVKAVQVTAPKRNLNPKAVLEVAVEREVLHLILVVALALVLMAKNPEVKAVQATAPKRNLNPKAVLEVAVEREVLHLILAVA